MKLRGLEGSLSAGMMRRVAGFLLAVGVELVSSAKRVEAPLGSWGFEVVDAATAFDVRCGMGDGLELGPTFKVACVH
jgi:hypothetical protein